MIGYQEVIMFLTVYLMLSFIMQICDYAFFSKRKRQGFVFSAVLIVIVTIAEYIGYKTQGIESVISTIIDFSISPFIAYFIARTLSSKPKYLGVLKYIVIINLILVITSVFTKLIFYYDENFIYHRGKGFLIYTGITIVSIFSALIELSNVSKKYQTKSYKIISLILMLLFFGIGCQILNSGIIIIKLSIAITLIKVYIFYFSMKYRIDGLTTLFNQEMWKKKIREYSDIKITIIIIDVHKFKFVNDNFGHQYGDKCLMTIARYLKENYAKHGLVFRIGGDEFGVLLKVFDEEELIELNKKLTLKINNERQKDKRFPQIDSGFCVFNPYSKGSIEEAIKEADEEMYRDKKKKYDEEV